MLKRLALYAAFAASALFPDLAHAQETEVLGSVGNLLDAIADVLTGRWAQAVGVIAVSIVGWMFLKGRLDMPYAIAVVAGLIFIFGAAEISQSIDANV